MDSRTHQRKADMTPNQPIPATRVPIETPSPPERPDLFMVVYRYPHSVDSWHGIGPFASMDVADCAVRHFADANAIDVSVFKLPADPKPAHPTPSDWRQACKVVKCAARQWDVLSPDGKHFLCGDPGDEWCEINSETHLKYGIFATEEIARSALSIAPVPPGVGR